MGSKRMRQTSEVAEEGIMADTIERQARMETALRLRGVHHLALNTDDMAKTADFYVRVLGMRLVHGFVTAPGAAERAATRGNPRYDCIRHYFFDMGGDSLLAFFEFPKGTARADRDTLATMQHVAFAATEEHFDAILERLKAHGVPIAAGPLLSVPPTTWSFYFFDPNGIRLEICTNKAPPAPDRIDVVRSCLATRNEMRAELETLSREAAWIETIIASMPD
jgi:catechol 2,3-dioxygenase-like lactoylglutathione lyase family enzyme